MRADSEIRETLASLVIFTQQLFENCVICLFVERYGNFHALNYEIGCCNSEVKSLQESLKNSTVVTEQLIRFEGGGAVVVPSSRNFFTNLLKAV